MLGLLAVVAVGEWPSRPEPEQPKPEEASHVTDQRDGSTNCFRSSNNIYCIVSVVFCATFAVLCLKRYRTKPVKLDLTWTLKPRLCRRKRHEQSRDN